MAVNLTINGTSYSFPNTGDETWGTNVTNWATAVSAYTLQRTGGAFTLTADVNFGGTFGLVSTYYKSATANIATVGVIRFANNEGVYWRNAANSADVGPLLVNASNQLTFSGATFVTTTGALTASRAVVTDGSSNLVTATTTAAEIAFVNGVTSAIQTQINTKITASSTDTLTNKSLTDANCGFVDDGDATKVFKVQCSGIATATTRTATVPDSDFTFVGTALTQTLTNKTSQGQKVSVAAKTTTYTILATDDVLTGDASGAAFTMTLPAASASVGQIFRIKKIDSSFNAVTIARAGSDTITDVASALTTTTINTQGEEIEIACVSSSLWQVTNRRIPSVWTTYSMTITGSSSNPSLGSTSVNLAQWKRIGDSVLIRYQLVMTSAGTAGSGSYLFAIPTGLTIDTAKISTAILSGQNVGVMQCTSDIVGFTAASTNDGHSFVYDTTHIGIKTFTTSTTQTIIGSAGYSLSNAALAYLFDALVPISGWNG